MSLADQVRLEALRPAARFEPRPAAASSPVFAAAAGVRRLARRLVPGLAAAAAVAALARGLEAVERGVGGAVWVDALVIAIIAGVAVRTIAGRRPGWEPGLRLAAKLLLEVAIVLLGASVAVSTVAATGLPVMAMVVVIVPAALLGGYAIGRLIGLPRRLATLVACGNAICGNSAILAVAPVVGAEAEEVAAAVAFTAALGVIVLLALPLGFVAFGLGERQYGLIAGLTVYAVPQVLAATLPVGPLAAQLGMIVKLARVMMLAPVILAIATFGRASDDRGDVSRGAAPAGVELRSRRGDVLRRAAGLAAGTWFIAGFFAMTAARGFGVLPAAMLGPIAETSAVLTLVSMAALGLSVDARTLLASGGRVLAAGALAILFLAGISAAAVAVLGSLAG